MSAILAIENEKNMVFGYCLPMGRKKIEVLTIGGAAVFIITDHNGKITVKDERQDVDCALQDAFKGYSMHEFNGVLSKMIGKEQAEKVIADVMQPRVPLSDGRFLTHDEIFAMIEKNTTSLDELVKNGLVTLKVQVYMNYRKAGRDAEDIFRSDFDKIGLEAPAYKKNFAQAKYKDGEMESPWYAWQGTVVIGKRVSNEALVEIKQIIQNNSQVFEDFNGTVIHSNALTKAILSKISKPNQPALSAGSPS